MPPWSRQRMQPPEAHPNPECVTKLRRKPRDSDTRCLRGDQPLARAATGMGGVDGLEAPGDRVARGPTRRFLPNAGGCAPPSAAQIESSSGRSRRPLCTGYVRSAICRPSRMSQARISAPWARCGLQRTRLDRPGRPAPPRLPGQPARRLDGAGHAQDVGASEPWASPAVLALAVDPQAFRDLGAEAEFRTDRHMAADVFWTEC